MKRVLLIPALLLTACSGTKSPAEFEAVTRDFVYSTLALSPIAATSAGYHKHDGVDLDALLDDIGPAGTDRQRAHYRAFQSRLQSFEREKLDPQSRADYGLISDQIALGLFELDEMQSWRHNPTVYVEALGNAIFTPFSVEYAPAADRYRHIRQRLELIPRYLEDAKKNLADTSDIWARVAIEENDGTIALIDKSIRETVPPDQQEAYSQAAAKALPALRDFSEFIRRLPSTGPEGWRAGKEKYAKKFRLAMGSDRPPEQVLAAAEASLTDIRREMFKLSLPLHQKFYPGHRDPVDVNLIVGETLAKIADQHPTRDGYFAAAQKTLDESRAFVQSKDFLPLPDTSNLKIIPTPVFMRGLYGVGGFSPAPSLEPKLQAYYWLTPIPPEWSKERAESKLREYNNYGLQMLTIHEAIPGHYVQYEYGNRVEPGPRRLLRSVFGSGVYVEGWAMYSMEVMCDEGYMGNSPELRLTLYKHFLRSIANAIMDIRFHTQGLKDEEAMDLMVKRTFQEREEAIAKLQRAKLAVAQLPTYWVGYQEWKRLRADWKGSSKDFNERGLLAGALPMNELRRLLLSQ